MRARRLIGLPVYRMSGRLLGRVEDVLLAPDRCRLVAVLCRPPLWRPTVYLPPSAWQTCTETHLVAAAEPSVAPEDGRRLQALMGTRVCTKGGRELGWLSDAEVAPGGGVVGWLLSRGTLVDLVHGLQRLPPRPLRGEQELCWHDELVEGDCDEVPQLQQ